MNDGKVIVQVHPAFASSNVKFIRLPNGFAKVIRKGLKFASAAVLSIPQAAQVASPYISGGLSFALENGWTIVTVIALYQLHKQSRKSTGPRVTKASTTITEAELVELKALQPSQVAAFSETEKLSLLVEGLGRLVINRVDLVATEMVALPFFCSDLKAARDLFSSKRELLSYVCGKEGFDTLLQKKWEQVAAWRQQLATATEAVDVGLQRASFAQEYEWKDFKNWQRKLKLLDVEKEDSEPEKVLRNDPVYQSFQKWEPVIG